MHRKRYTREEDLKIRNTINNNPENISKALKELALELNRSYGGLSQRWYTVLSRQETSRNSASFIVLSKKKKIKARKNITHKNKEFLNNSKLTIWDRIRRIFQLSS